MNKLHLPKIETLPAELVTPERFGAPVVQAAAVLNLPLPEITRVYGLRPDTETTLQRLNRLGKVE